VSATQSSFQWLGNALNALSVVFMLLLLGSIVYQARTGQRLGVRNRREPRPHVHGGAAKRHLRRRRLE